MSRVSRERKVQVPESFERLCCVLGSFNSRNWSDSKVLDSTGLSCCAFTRNQGAISQLSMCVLIRSWLSLVLQEESVDDA